MPAENKLTTLAQLIKGLTRATADEVENLIETANASSDETIQLRIRHQLQETFRVLAAQLITLKSEPQA